MTEELIPFRLLRADDRPATNPHNLRYEFGLQDVKQNIFPGTLAWDGSFIFDFQLRVREPADRGPPIFGGPFASGGSNDRFVSLSWRSIGATTLIA